ncbi:uncharacterized protein DUF4255 [Mumia flava]|uniref:Uncharacterized protein DUF4255 n=1 Tax=Mumia flava TaxID=1348852 RepID=A0A0B2B711_9ACTN|nr:DUF4255 domain-containing protein [Mumia flava]PJJ57877.1 uncharacterized protein DUF4255 [Mumia flava]
MSTSFPIATVTAALRSLLRAQVPLVDDELADLAVTTQPPDRARQQIGVPSLDLYLYATSLGGTSLGGAGMGGGQPPPGPVFGRDRGRSAAPPVLDLHYLLTAYGPSGDRDTVDQRILGAAMGVLHDRPVLSGADEVPGSGPSDATPPFDSVRIAPTPLSIDDLAHLWSALRTPLRLSAAYTASVVPFRPDV